MTPRSAIAHFAITGKLGEGGMGAVYRAADRWITYNVAPDGRVLAFVPEGDNSLARMASHATFLLNFFDELKRRLP